MDSTAPVWYIRRGRRIYFERNYKRPAGYSQAGEYILLHDETGSYHWTYVPRHGAALNIPQPDTNWLYVNSPAKR